MTTNNRIACVFAHPDDETYCVGGIVAKLADAGIKTDLFCATDGDAGKNSGVPVSSREELGRLRRAETLAAARILGIESVQFGGYRDGALQEVDPAELTGAIVGFIRQRRPTIVITFGPEGAPTGHRDHRAMSRTATAAFFLAQLRTSFPEQLDQGLVPHRATRLFYHAWRFPHKDPALKLESVPPTVDVNVSGWRQRKLAAFMAHETQRYGYDRFVDDVLLDSEFLALAAGTPQSRDLVDDPFDGL
jgi:LmbE family N-acetylglucosaminyl deacetylase